MVMGQAQYEGLQKASTYWVLTAKADGRDRTVIGSSLSAPIDAAALVPPVP